MSKSEFGFIPFLLPGIAVAAGSQLLSENQLADIEAINKYVANFKPRTQKASDLRDDWIRWYDQLSWYQKNLEPGTFDEARNRRNAINLADATTAQERENVEWVIKEGASSEQMKGGVDRRLANGMLPGESKPLIDWKVYAVLATGALAALGGGAIYVKKVYLDRLF